KGRVELVAETGRDQAHVLALVIQPPNGSPWSQDVGGMAAAVVKTGQQHVLGCVGFTLVGSHQAVRPAGERRILGQLSGVGPGVVADNEVEPVIGPVQDGVRSMLAHAATFSVAWHLYARELVQQLDLVGTVLALGIAHPIKSSSLGS